MKLFNNIDEIHISEGTCVALGNFDGVHLGHRRIIRDTVRKAEEKGLKSAVFTFSSHPRSIIEGVKPVKSITTQAEKAALLEELGVDYIVNVPFTREILTTDAKTFIDYYLVEKLKMKEVFCGFNYRYGYRALGDTKLLRIEGSRRGFKVNVVQPVTVDGDIVSSTLIRGLIKSGEMEEAKKFLGRTYCIGGEVVVGNQIGRTIGFPTLNLTIDEDMVTPPNGVYITNCIFFRENHPSITNIGVRPTIGSFKKNVETHIFDFNQDLYGEKIKVEFLKKVRDEVKFSNLNQLSDQISADCKEARSYHGLQKLMEE